MSALARIKATLEAELADVPFERRLVAVSGGLDSTVLVTALAALHAGAGQAPPRAVHIDHGLHPQSGQWAAATRQRCAALGVPCSVVRVTVAPTGRGLEAEARHARYAAFADHLEADEHLLLAQHRDDQVETLLLRLLRGSGPAGLAAMPRRRALGRGWLLRPLLALDRALLEQAAAEASLAISTDPSNAELTQDRNYLRHEILPRMAERWPGYRDTLSRAAELCAEQERALNILLGDAGPAGPLPLTELDGAAEVAALRLRRWLDAAGVAAPSRARLAEILRQKDARTDAQVAIEVADVVIRRHAGALHVVPIARPEPPAEPLTWQPPDPLELSHGRLAVQATVGDGLRQGRESFTVDFRRGGERLKKRFQEVGIPPWERDRLPLLYAGETLVAVADRWIAEGWQAEGEQPGWQLRWDPD